MSSVNSVALIKLSCRGELDQLERMRDKRVWKAEREPYHYGKDRVRDQDQERRYEDENAQAMAVDGSKAEPNCWNRHADQKEGFVPLPKF